VQNLRICCLAQNGSISVNMFSMNMCAFPCSNLHDQLKSSTPLIRVLNLARWVCPMMWGCSISRKINLQSS
jgi:hypothetical protein